MQRLPPCVIAPQIAFSAAWCTDTMARYTGFMAQLSGERRAIAAALLAFYGFLFLLSALMGPGPLAPLVFGLAAVYAVGFFALVAGYFWARWFAMGLGLHGLMTAGLAMITGGAGADPGLLFFGGTHLAIAALLTGRAAATAFDGRSDWRERWKMDQDAVNRLGKSVMRAGMLLPMFVIMGLAPRDAGLDGTALVFAVAGAVGVGAFLRMRTWGVLVTSAAALTGSAATLCDSSLRLSTSASLPGWLLACLVTTTAVLVVSPLVPRRRALLRG